MINQNLMIKLNKVNCHLMAVCLTSFAQSLFVNKFRNSNLAYRQ